MKFETFQLLLIILYFILINCESQSPFIVYYSYSVLSETNILKLTNFVYCKISHENSENRSAPELSEPDSYVHKLTNIGVSAYNY